MGADSHDNERSMMLVVPKHAFALLEIEYLDLKIHGLKTVVKLFNP